MRQLAHLLRRQRAVGHGDAQHVGVQLQIETVHQPQRLELVFGQFARQAARHLAGELVHPLADELGVEFVIAVHDRPHPGAAGRRPAQSSPSARMRSRRRSATTLPSTSFTVSISRLMTGRRAWSRQCAASRASASSGRNRRASCDRFDPAVLRVEVDRRAGQELVAGQDFHHATLNCCLREAGSILPVAGGHCRPDKDDRRTIGEFRGAGGEVADGAAVKALCHCARH